MHARYHMHALYHMLARYHMHVWYHMHSTVEVVSHTYKDVVLLVIIV